MSGLHAVAQMDAMAAKAGLGLPGPTPAEADRGPVLPRLGVLYTFDSGEKSIRRALDFSNSRGVRSILDSGAWSVFNAGAVIDPARHAAVINDLVPTHPLTRFVGLDVIGDEEETYRNWMLQRELGAPVEPTIHFGADPAYVDRYLKEGLAENGAGETWLNCGGMVVASSRPTWIRAAMSWVAAVRRRLPEHVLVHGLGMTTPKANDLIRFDSVDSSYWLVSYARNRTLPLFDPTRRKWARFTLMTSTPEYARESRASFKGHGPLLREVYGTSMAELWEMGENERLALSIRSHALFADTYRARHGYPSSPIVYLAGAPSSPTASTGELMDPIARWATEGLEAGA